MKFPVWRHVVSVVLSEGMLMHTSLTTFLEFRCVLHRSVNSAALTSPMRCQKSAPTASTHFKSARVCRARAIKTTGHESTCSGSPFYSPVMPALSSQL